MGDAGQWEKGIRGHTGKTQLGCSPHPGALRSSRVPSGHPVSDIEMGLSYLVSAISQMSSHGVTSQALWALVSPLPEGHTLSLRVDLLARSRGPGWTPHLL